MLRTLVVLLLLHALLLQVTAEPAASTAAAAKPKKEKRKKAPKEEVDIFADDYEDEEEEAIAKKKRLGPLFFTNLDTNKNGHIAWEEFDPFIKAVHRYPHLYKPWKKALKHTRDWVTKRDARHESDMDDLEKMMKGEL